MTISYWKKPIGLHGLYINISVLLGQKYTFGDEWPGLWKALNSHKITQKTKFSQHIHYAIETHANNNAYYTVSYYYSGQDLAAIRLKYWTNKAQLSIKIH